MLKVLERMTLKVWSCNARDSTLVSTTFVLQHYCLSTLPALLTFLTLTLSQTSTNTRHLLNIAYKAPIPPRNRTNFHQIVSNDPSQTKLTCQTIPTRHRPLAPSAAVVPLILRSTHIHHIHHIHCLQVEVELVHGLDREAVDMVLEMRSRQ
jgi:hypothetical protein